MFEQAKLIFQKLLKLPLAQSNVLIVGATGLAGVVIAAAVLVGTSSTVMNQEGLIGSSKSSTGSSPSTSGDTDASSAPSASPSASASASSTSPSPSSSPSESSSSQNSSGPTASQLLAMEQALAYFDDANWQWFRPDLSRTIVTTMLQDDGFSAGDATYAANNISADWVAEATSMAFEGENFSLDDQNTSWYSKAWLISRLQSSGFSLSEATQGVNAMADANGVDWGYHALNRVNEYDPLPQIQDYINQLLSEGFTQAEAEYATDGW